MLQGSRAEFLITKREMVLGRSTEDQKVDIDLVQEVGPNIIDAVAAPIGGP